MPEAKVDSAPVLPALIVAGAGLFFPNVTEGGLLMEWRFVQDAFLDEPSEGAITVKLVGDLKISVKSEHWQSQRRSGCPARASSIRELRTTYGPTPDEGKAPDAANALDYPLSDKAFEDLLLKTERSRFINAAVDDLTSALSFYQILSKDPRIAIDLSGVWKGYEEVLSLANPASAILTSLAATATTPKDQPNLALRRQYLIVLSTYAYLDRVSELTTAFKPFITSKLLPKARERTKCLKLAQAAEESVKRFTEFAAPFFSDND